MGEERNKTKKNAETRMLNLWQRMHREGTEFFVDGESVHPRDAVVKAVREEGSYMTDYVLGEKGKIEQVRLDKVYPD